MAVIDLDVDDFFNDDVAVDAIYTPSGGQPSTVSVILDRPHIEKNPFNETSINDRETMVTVKTSDFENCEQGETLEIDSTIYYLLDPQLDIGISEIKISLDDPNES